MCHEVLEWLVVELSAIVGREMDRDIELGENVLPNEFLALLGSDCCESFYLYPFGEVIDCHNHILFLALRF